MRDIVYEQKQKRLLGTYERDENLSLFSLQNDYGYIFLTLIPSLPELQICKFNDISEMHSQTDSSTTYYNFT